VHSAAFCQTNPIHLSVTSQSTVKTVRDRPMDTMGTYRNPQSKLASQNAAKWCHTQRWFVLTAYRNIPSPYPTVSSSTPRGIPSQKWAVKKLN